MLITPSIIAHFVNALIMLFAVLFLIVYFAKVKSLDTYHILIIILLFAIAIGVHGMSHLGLEREYGYNPLTFTPTPKAATSGGCPCRAMMAQAKMKGM